LSVDALRGQERRGTLWALAALAAGILGAEAVERLAAGDGPHLVVAESSARAA
jgi:hypothetical protein